MLGRCVVPTLGDLAAHVDKVVLVEVVLFDRFRLSNDLWLGDLRAHWGPIEVRLL